MDQRVVQLLEHSLKSQCVTEVWVGNILFRRRGAVKKGAEQANTAGYR